MKAKQVAYGRDLVDKIARKWGTTPEQTLVILEGREYDEFFDWVNARQFLEEDLYFDEEDEYD